MKARGGWLLGGVVIGAAITVPAVRYLDGGSRLIAANASPEGRYRVDMYTPSRGQRLFEPGRDSPAFVRLTRLADGAELGDSDVFEIAGEGTTPIWFPGGVQQGSSASFEFRKGRWETDPNH